MVSWVLHNYPRGLLGGMVLAAGSSVLVSTATFALLMGLDGGIVLLIVLGSTLLLPLTLPIVALVLLGLPLKINNWELSGRLVLLIGSVLFLQPLAAGFLGRQKSRAALRH